MPHAAGQPTHEEYISTFQEAMQHNHEMGARVHKILHVNISRCLHHVVLSVCDLDVSDIAGLQSI